MQLFSSYASMSSHVPSVLFLWYWKLKKQVLSKIHFWCVPVRFFFFFFFSNLHSAASHLLHWDMYQFHCSSPLYSASTSQRHIQTWPWHPCRWPWHPCIIYWRLQLPSPLPWFAPMRTFLPSTLMVETVHLLWRVLSPSPTSCILQKS